MSITHEELKTQNEFQKKIYYEILQKQYNDISKSVEFFWNSTNKDFMWDFYSYF